MTETVKQIEQNLIERVARAIYDADDDRVADGSDRWEWWTSEARAAISAVLDAAGEEVSELLNRKAARNQNSPRADTVTEWDKALQGLHLLELELPATPPMTSVDTVSQMSHLPEGTVVISADDRVWLRLEFMWAEPGSVKKCASFHIALPATIVRRGVNL
jgi:hypothetical protein